MWYSAVGCIVTLTLSLLAAPLTAQAQVREKPPRVGVLESGSQQPPFPCLPAFQQGLRDLGYMEGHTIVLEYRYAENQPDRLPALAAALVQRQPDTIWTSSSSAAQALKQATTTIPIVVGVAVDLVEQGLVESLARPGGNLTGLDTQYLELTSKRLELLKDAVPQITRVAILVDPTGTRRVSDRIPSAFEAEAWALGLHLLRVEASDPGTLDAAFTTMVEQRADALVLMDSRIFRTHRHRLAARSRFRATGAACPDRCAERRSDPPSVPCSALVPASDARTTATLPAPAHARRGSRPACCRCC